MYYNDTWCFIVIFNPIALFCWFVAKYITVYYISFDKSCEANVTLSNPFTVRVDFWLQVNKAKDQWTDKSI